ncbi:MAG: hypothetical protein ACAI44_37060, partial [Candidatus Sericytochromatia bacterium]
MSPKFIALALSLTLTTSCGLGPAANKIPTTSNQSSSNLSAKEAEAALLDGLNRPTAVEYAVMLALIIKVCIQGNSSSCSNSKSLSDQTINNKVEVDYDWDSALIKNVSFTTYTATRGDYTSVD